MTAFLQQVARHYFSLGEMDKRCFIFPNKRSLAFFKKYLSECVAEQRRPMLSPQLYTMNDFFYQLTDFHPTDQVDLLLELYDCYKSLNPCSESLDEFIFWGGVLIGDFNDVDKYLVDPASLFVNVAEFRAIQDDYDYLTDDQKAAIERFVGHFDKTGKYKEEFRKIWDILLPLYRKFNESLTSKGRSYEGQVYRALATRLKEESVVDVLSAHFAEDVNFVFVGLNALNECEKVLLKRLRNSSRAEFCWDYSSEWIKDPKNKSSFFLSQNISDFPQAFDLDEGGLKTAKFNVVSVPSSVGQAKMLPSIFEQLGTRGIETAVVLPDENLLLPVLNSIPEHLQQLNVTMGYPMSGSSLWSLMHDIATMQIHLRLKDDKWYVYHKQLSAVFSNSLFKSILTEEEQQLVARVKGELRQYVSVDSLAVTPLLSKIFKVAISDVASICSYQKEILTHIGPLLKDNPDMALELDFAKDYYLDIVRLEKRQLDIRPSSYFRLLDKLLSRKAVPFQGEPLSGLQIMGPLETRALDFKNLIILSCNEGVFPRKSVGASFVPAELRKGFGLPTYEYQDAVWAYYFYRMIQRAENVWLLYDSRTEALKSGEESRYIKQLEMHFGADMKRLIARAPIGLHTSEDTIEKTQAHVDIIKGKMLSASSLQNYLSCPAKFYYHTVCGLGKTEEVLESLDSRTIGNVFHKVMQDLYTVKGGIITMDYLKDVMSADKIVKAVRECIISNIKGFELVGKNLIYEDMICRYVRQVISRDMELLASYGKDSFKVLGLEATKTMNVDGFNFIGHIDRFDSFTPGEVRVVDYKTGKVTDADFIINDSNAEKVAQDLFGSIEKLRPKIALQLYIYDRLVSSEYSGKKIVNSIYQPNRLFIKDIENIELCDAFLEIMEQKLSELLKELADVSVPFVRSKDPDSCKCCDFKTICGR